MVFILKRIYVVLHVAILYNYFLWCLGYNLHVTLQRDGRVPSHSGFKWSVGADVESLAWDPHDQHLFVVSDTTILVVYDFIRLTISRSCKNILLEGWSGYINCIHCVIVGLVWPNWLGWNGLILKRIGWVCLFICHRKFQIIDVLNLSTNTYYYNCNINLWITDLEVCFH